MVFAQKTILLESRRAAVKQKYLQYAMDPAFRRAYRNRIYYNVNKDVPATDTLHMSSTALLPAPEPEALTVEQPSAIRMRAGAGSPHQRPGICWRPSRVCGDVMVGQQLQQYDGFFCVCRKPFATQRSRVRAAVL